MSSSGSPSAEKASQSGYNFNDHLQGPPRKKMRKGTKSCIECRRRKIKCTFEPGRTQICNECHARGSTCIDQEHGDATSVSQPTSATETSSLKERVSHLEDLLKQVLHRLPFPEQDDGHAGISAVASPVPPTGTPTTHTQVDAQAAEVLKSLRSPSRNGKANVDESAYFGSTPRDSVPILSLFDNAVIETKEIPPTMSRESYNKSKALISALLQMLPPVADLEKILESSQEWWVIWKTMFPTITDQRCLTIKEAVSHTLRSEKPAEVGKIMLCIALSIQQLPPGFDWESLSVKESPQELMERYMSSIDRYIISDEEIAATIDGIECMVMTAKYHINMGRPRKSWLLYQRAIAFAQLLGLHRLAQRKPKDSDPQFARSIATWCHIVVGERYLALFLGLPYSIHEKFLKKSFQVAKELQSQGDSTGEINLCENYICEVLPVVTKMIDRNQDPSETPYSVTMQLEQELEDVRSKTRAAWWTTERIPGSSIEEHFERLQVQFFHHHTRVLLHMPFMLKSSADKRYHYSHTAALESSREMIQYYDALRGSESIGPHACKMIDFQAFAAAMLLLLNLFGYSQHNRATGPQPADLDQDQEDSARVDRAIHLLKGAAQDAGGMVAANSAQCLEMCAMARQGLAEGESHPESCQVSIPYFGTIKITAGKQFVRIKPGTYPEAGKPRSQLAQMGLPTPPSMTSGHSAQPSPRDSLLSVGNRESPYWNNNDMIASGINQQWTGNKTDDPFITFDSFMAFPSAHTIDFSGMTVADQTTGGSSSSSEGFMQQPAFGGLGTLEEQNMAAGYPFPMTNGGNVDLDGGWNWFGVGAPAV